MEDFDKIILGIDPGTNILGYGLIGIQNKQLNLISTGILRMSKLENHQLKLKKIFESPNQPLDIGYTVPDFSAPSPDGEIINLNKDQLIKLSLLTIMVIFIIKGLILIINFIIDGSLKKKFSCSYITMCYFAEFGLIIKSGYKKVDDMIFSYLSF